MKFDLQGIPVYFPYEFIYPEQYQYMCFLKRSLDVNGHCLLEMPTGTGKTIALLSFITSYQLERPDVGKLIYCTRTVQEMEKVLKELQDLMRYRNSHFTDVAAPAFLALGMSSRSNLCVHPDVYGKGSRDAVDALCNQRTAPWVREKREEQGFPTIPDIEDLDGCHFYERLQRDEDEAAQIAESSVSLPPGVYTLKDLRKLGQERSWCPYFLARRVIDYANVVVFNYQCLIDPKVAEAVGHHLDKNCVVVFDEAHNIDNIAIEALTVHLRRQTLHAAGQNLQSLGKVRHLTSPLLKPDASQKVKECKGRVRDRLKEEHRRFAEGLVMQGVVSRHDAEAVANPVIPSDLPKETVPGSIRRAEHFVAFLTRLLDYLWTRMDVEEVEAEGPEAFVRRMPSESVLDRRSLRGCHDRLYSLINTLEISNTDQYLPIRLVCDFGTLVGTYTEGFQIIIEPYDERTPHIAEPILQLACLDASIAMAPVFEKFRSVIITSGTLTPLDFFPKILEFHPVVAESLSMTLTRECLCPVVVKCGADQGAISTEISVRHDDAVVRNYGRLLMELCRIVPDGIVCFFVSYEYMKRVTERWHLMKILEDISQHKLPFFETQDVAKTSAALTNYRRACDCGRGGVFFSIARGKVAEGIDFNGHYGRCVMMVGIPYQYTLCRVLLARLTYLHQRFGITNRDYLNFDALRQAAQCAGRVIRDKSDYGMMVFADKRYGRADKVAKLPGWIREYLRDSHMNLSTEMAIHIAKTFLRKMAQPLTKREREQGLLTLRQVTERERETDAVDAAAFP